MGIRSYPPDEMWAVRFSNQDGDSWLVDLCGSESMAWDVARAWEQLGCKAMVLRAICDWQMVERSEKCDWREVE